jgi:type IX secretion system substrate protein
MVALLASTYNYAQTISKPEQIAILIAGNYGYNDIVLNAWPIPAKQNVHININSPTSDKGFISVYDLSGMLVAQEFITIKNGENNYTLEIDNVNSGVHVVKISSTSFNISKRIVLE